MRLALWIACLALCFEPRLAGALRGFARRAGLRIRLGQGLGPRIPFVVSALGLLALFLALALGFGAPGETGRVALGLPLFLLALADARAYWLPFSVTLPLAALGMIAAAHEGLWLEALMGGLVWGGAPAGIAWVYRKWRGREGLGGGDIALMGALGVWCGPERGAYAVFSATLAALLSTLALRGLGIARGPSPRLPLGPYLCLGFYAAGQ